MLKVSEHDGFGGKSTDICKALELGFELKLERFTADIVENMLNVEIIMLRASGDFGIGNFTIFSNAVGKGSEAPALGQ